MKTEVIYSDARHRWLMFGRDAEKPEHIIDTNQYLVAGKERAILLDPGGIELFAPMLAAVVKEIPVEQVTDLFASHQDPDIISSVGLWDQVLPHARLHAPWLWEGFIRHFGMSNIDYVPLPDEGGTLELDGFTLEFIPAHYLHASGNFHVYDPQAKILMSGDVGAALEPMGAPLYVDDFQAHIDKMAYFHQRWMPSNRAKQAWLERVRRLEIEHMLPQHGRIFSGDDVQRFFDWFEALDVGIAANPSASG